MIELVWTSTAPDKPGYYWYKSRFGKGKVVEVLMDGSGLYIIGEHTYHRLYVNYLVTLGDYFSDIIPYPKTQPTKELNNE